jgi:hypothetical protein
MASPKKQFLTANEVDANPALLRHPDAREKRRRRDGQVAGASKRQIPGPFNWRLIEMKESFAYRVLSLSAHRVLDRIEIEFVRHGSKPEENGALPVTYGDFVDYGINRPAIAPAIRELVALGFVEVTRRGSAGNEEYRQPTLFLITYYWTGSNVEIRDGWRRIKSLEEAEAVAVAARANKADPRARGFGKRGAAARWRKQNPGDGNHTEPGMVSIPKTGLVSMETIPNRGDSPSSVSIPLSRLSLGGRRAVQRQPSRRSCPPTRFLRPTPTRWQHRHST